MPLKSFAETRREIRLEWRGSRNGDKRASFVIQNKACILREKDIMQAEAADTPAKRIYFPIMMMYLEPDEADVYYGQFALRMTEFMDAIRDRKAFDHLRRNQPRCHGRQLLQSVGQVQESFRVRTGTAQLWLFKRIKTAARG